MPAATRLERRLRRFAMDLRRAWSKHSGFSAFAVALDSVDWGRAAAELNEAGIEHAPLVLGRKDIFITAVLPGNDAEFAGVPLLREMQLETVWAEASATNKEIIWMNLELVMSAACPELKTMLKSRDETAPFSSAASSSSSSSSSMLSAAMAALGGGGMGGGGGGVEKLLGAFMGAFGGGGAGGGGIDLSPETMRKLTQGEAGAALQGLMSSPEIFEALGKVAANLKENGVSPEGLRSAVDGGMLDSLRSAMRHEPVRQHMRTVIAHFAPIFSKFIKNAQKSGADTSNPAMQIVLRIIGSAEGHAWAKLVDRLGTPEGAEAILEIASSADPATLSREKVAAAMGIDPDQLPELMESLKRAALVVRDSASSSSSSSSAAAPFASIAGGLLESLSALQQ